MRKPSVKFLQEKKMRNMIEYGNYIDNRGVLGIVRRACNYVDARLRVPGGLYRIQDTRQAGRLYGKGNAGYLHPGSVP